MTIAARHSAAGDLREHKVAVNHNLKESLTPLRKRVDVKTDLQIELDKGTGLICMYVMETDTESLKWDFLPSTFLIPANTIAIECESLHVWVGGKDVKTFPAMMKPFDVMYNSQEEPEYLGANSTLATDSSAQRALRVRAVLCLHAVSVDKTIDNLWYNADDNVLPAYITTYIWVAEL